MKKLVLLIIIISIGGILPLLYQYGCYCFIADFVNQYIPFIYEAKRMLSSGVPFWSWNLFFGDNYWVAGMWTSPFVWINCLFPDEYLLQGITFTFVLRMICSGLTSYVYLRKMDITEEWARVGGIMYAFSSVVIINFINLVFEDTYILFPLLLLAIEKYIRKERYGFQLIAVLVAVSICSSFYMSVCSFLQSIIYVFFRLLLCKELRISTFQVLKGIAAGILGIMLGAIFLLPALYQLSGGSRNNLIDFGCHFWVINNILDRLTFLFVARLTDGPLGDIGWSSGWNSNAVHIPVFGVLLALIYIIKKRDWLSYLLLFLTVCYLTPINGIFSFFTNPLYTRWTYGFSLLIILATLKILLSKEYSIKTIDICAYTFASLLIFAMFLGCKVDGNGNLLYLLICLPLLLWLISLKKGLRKTVLISLVTLSILIIFFVVFRIFSYQWFYNSKETLLACGSVVFFIVLSTSCLLFIRKSHSSNAVLFITSLFCLIHVFVTSLRNSDWYFHTLLHQSKTDWDTVCEYKPHYEPAKNFMYRTDFIEPKYPNISQLVNSSSLTGYNSIQNSKTQQLQCLADTTAQSNCILRINPCNHRDSYEALMSVKYINNENGLSANPYYIPMGFAYDKYIIESDFEPILAGNKEDLFLQMLNTLVIKDEDEPVLSNYLYKSDLNTNLGLDSISTIRRNTACSDFVGTTKGFSAKIDIETPQILFYSVPADDGFTAYVDGIKTNIYEVNMGMMAILVEKGVHTIEFKYVPYGLKTGFIISLLTFVVLILPIFDIKYRAKKCFHNL